MQGRHIVGKLPGQDIRGILSENNNSNSRNSIARSSCNWYQSSEITAGASFTQAVYIPVCSRGVKIYRMWKVPQMKVSLFYIIRLLESPKALLVLRRVSKWVIVITIVQNEIRQNSQLRPQVKIGSKTMSLLVGCTPGAAVHIQNPLVTNVANLGQTGQCGNPADLENQYTQIVRSQVISAMTSSRFHQLATFRTYFTCTRLLQMLKAVSVILFFMIAAFSLLLQKIN